MWLKTAAEKSGGATVAKQAHVCDRAPLAEVDGRYVVAAVVQPEVGQAGPLPHWFHTHACQLQRFLQVDSHRIADARLALDDRLRDAVDHLALDEAPGRPCAPSPSAASSQPSRGT